MKTREVDPRDMTWEDDSPVFRVYFWKATPTPPDAENPYSWRSMEYEVSEADVKEVINWADQYAEREGENHYTLYVRGDDAQGPGIIKLAGVDPTDASTA